MTLDPAYHAFEVFRGASLTEHLELFNDEEETEATDLTGWSARMPIVATAPSNVPGLELTSEPGGGITLGGALGTVDLLITDEVTTDLPFEKAEYTLFLTNPDGHTDAYIYGKLKIETP